MLLTLLCALLLQAAASSLTPFTIFMGILGLLVSIGAGSFFVKYGTRLAMVEKESADTKRNLEAHAAENKASFEKHAAELNTANTQVALVAAALETIKSTLNELKQDVKDWMKSHQSTSSHPSE